MKFKNGFYRITLIAFGCILVILTFTLTPLYISAQNPTGTRTLSPNDRIGTIVAQTLTAAAANSISTPAPRLRATETPISDEAILAFANATLTALAPVCTEELVQGGIPALSTYELTIEPNEFHVWSSGLICFSFDGSQPICMPGGADRGNVTIFLPIDEQETTYSLSRLTPRHNFHGIYADCSDVQRDEWIEIYAYNLSQSSNCSSGNGCGHVEVITVRGDEFEQLTYTP